MRVLLNSARKRLIRSAVIFASNARNSARLKFEMSGIVSLRWQSQILCAGELVIWLNEKYIPRNVLPLSAKWHDILNNWFVRNQRRNVIAPRAQRTLAIFDVFVRAGRRPPSRLVPP